MKLKPFLKASLLLFSLSSLIALTSCGGGGSDDGEFTIRPQSLDGVVINFSGASLEFVSSSSSSDAVNDTVDIETGAVIYTPTGAPDVLDAINSSTNITAIWPSATGALTYQYVGLSDNTGQITIVNNGLSTFVNSVNVSGTEPHSYLNSNNTLVINLTFESIGSNIAVTTTALSNIDNATGAPILQNNAAATTTILSLTAAATAIATTSFFVPTVSFGIVPINPIDPTAFISSVTFTLRSGVLVPINFGSADNPDRQRTTPLTLNTSLISFTDASTPPAADFTLQFTSNVVGNPDFDVPEEGSAIYTDIPGGTTTVDYEFTTDEDTSTSTIVLSTTGTPRAELGTITLNFTSLSTANSDGGGSYISGGTGNTGSFIISLGAP